jgi:NADP-dependent 3-hydroxy acid dehydrogenase YdfG
VAAAGMTVDVRVTSVEPGLAGSPRFSTWAVRDIGGGRATC